MGLTIAVTGGTGSFGNAVVSKLIHDAFYDKIIVYSRDEQKQEQMARRFDNPKLRFFIGDIRDKERLKMALHPADHIIHAAALKIVPAGEYNPFEFVKTNILGTQNVLEAVPVRKHVKMIMLSTDKAALPINLYGATKLAAEKLTIAFNNVHGQNGPSFSVVRYGNVANSNGSVIPLFAQCFKENNPFPITHKDMTRYYITLEEAADFVLSKLLAFDAMQGGETFIPSMPSFKITDLCKAFTNGKTPRIKIIGIRPGEKIHETIDGVRHSCDNDTWLKWQELRSQLLGLGYQLEWKHKQVKAK